MTGLLTALTQRDGPATARGRPIPASSGRPGTSASSDALVRPRPPERYVATDLDWWETGTPGPDQDELCERCGYRRLDPVYFAWLREMLVRARDAHARGELSEGAYQHLRGRFNALQEWARARFGESALVAAVTAFRPGSYRPPGVWIPEPRRPDDPSWLHRFPAGGDWLFQEPVSAAALAKVDAIRDRALGVGWSEASLYQNRSHLLWPHGHDWGLVSLLGPGDMIGEITGEGIELWRGTEKRGIFVNHHRRHVHAQPAASPGLGEERTGL